MVHGVDKEILTWLGLVSGAVIVGGVIVLVLQTQIANTDYIGWDWDFNRTELYTTFDDTKTIPKTSIVVGNWVLGIWYIIPGIIGLVAAFVQNICMYVTTCICTSISLFIMSIYIILYAIVALVFVALNVSYTASCKDVGGNCTCRIDNSTTVTPNKTCSDLSKFNALVTTAFAFLILTWVAEVPELILACYYTCRRKPVVNMPYQQPMLGPGPYMMPQGYSHSGPYMMPQGYSHPGPDSMPQAHNQPRH